MQCLSYAMCSSVLREVVAHAGSTVDDRWRPWKTQDSNIFHDALLTYSNHGAVRTYEKFRYWMSWLRARLNRIWPRNLFPGRFSLALEVGRPTSKAREKRPGDEVVDHGIPFIKRKSTQTFFPDLNSIFQTLFRSVNLLSIANFKTLSRI